MTLWGSHLPSKLRSPRSGPWSEYKRPIEFRTEPLRTPCVPALARVRWSGHGCGPGHRMLTLTFGQWEQRGRQYLYHLPEPDLGKALLCPGSEALGSLPMALPMPTTHIPSGLYLLPHSPEAVETKLSLTTSQRAAAILAGALVSTKGWEGTAGRQRRFVGAWWRKEIEKAGMGAGRGTQVWGGAAH